MTLPPVLVLEPTNRCNMVCDMCPQSLQDVVGDMDVALASRIVREVGSSCKYIQCYLLGEPTVRRDICEFVKAIRPLTQAVIEISTNVIRFSDAQFADSFLRSGVDRLLCCVEGMSSESHRKLRKSGNFDKTVEAIKYLGRRSLQCERPVQIVAKCILNKNNQHESEMFMEFWSAQPGITPAITWLNTWAGSLVHVRQYAVDLCPNAERERQACSELWNKIVVRWNGKVVACCHDWANSIELGDATLSSLNDIWTGTALKKLRAEHLMGNFAGICSSCVEWSTPEEFEVDYGLERNAVMPPLCRA
jgi:molybdenum cofactor biosynthesis enzyme MoaA